MSDKKFTLHVMTRSGHERRENLTLDEVIDEARSEVANNKKWLHITMENGTAVFFKTITELESKHSQLVEAINTSSSLKIVSSVVGGNDPADVAVIDGNVYQGDRLMETIIVGGRALNLNEFTRAGLFSEIADELAEMLPEDDEDGSPEDDTVSERTIPVEGPKREIRVLLVNKPEDNAVIRGGTDFVSFNYNRGNAVILEAIASVLTVIDKVTPEFHGGMSVTEPTELNSNVSADDLERGDFTLSSD